MSFYSSRVANINPKARINIEEFIRIAPDVVIYYNVPDAIRKFEEAGIPDAAAAVAKRARRHRCIARRRRLFRC